MCFVKMVDGRVDGQRVVVVGASERPQIPGRICCERGHQEGKEMARLP